jgi:hypothetical protein
MLKPTAYLTFIIDQELESMGATSLLKRAFMYIAPLKVVFDAELQGKNLIQMEVRLPDRPYWQANNSEKDELWETMVLPWIINKANRLQDTITALNNPKARSFEYAIDFSLLNLVLEDQIVSLSLVENLLPDVKLELNRVRNAT